MMLCNTKMMLTFLPKGLASHPKERKGCFVTQKMMLTKNDALPFVIVAPCCASEEKEG
jgi:hypothetical protein